eukprot:COSAG05_NODE_54_length_23549_cov_81.790840_2_plen_364_part_00
MLLGKLSPASIAVARMLHDGVPVQAPVLRVPEPCPESFKPCLRPNFRPSRGGLRGSGELPTVVFPLLERDPEATLRDACERGDMNAATHWLSAGARVNSVDHHGCTALHAAAGRGHDEVLQLLLESNADFTMRTNLGFDALALACQAGRAGCVEELLSAGAELESKCGVNGCTALHTAVRMGHVDVIRVLVMAGADQGALSVSGVTPQDICAVAPSASWVGYTASRILMDPGYLSPSDIENNFSPLHEMLGDGEIRTGMPARIVAPETQRKETVEARIETERTRRDVTARSQAAFKIAKAREEERRQALEDDMRRALSKDEEREASFARTRDAAEARTQKMLITSGRLGNYRNVQKGDEGSAL